MFSYTSYKSGDLQKYALLSPENNENDRPWSTLQPTKRSPAKRRLKNFSEPPLRQHSVQVWRVNVDTHLVDSGDTPPESSHDSEDPPLDPLPEVFDDPPARKAQSKSFTDSVARAELKKRNSVRFTQTTYMLKRLDSISCQMLMLAIILTDLVLAFHEDIATVTFIILSLYSIEIFIRGIHYHYWLNILNVLDVLIVVARLFFKYCQLWTISKSTTKTI